ncbi:probable LRR receptor-like serine/threonine-protein kinase At1g56140 [Rhododendron vialii]|uniref:probable LRR receptor-like serine/threonine-protein kinase At1g56140 n=1 Tax=Rhododendron vialii TaxID=182163 RepID=UPI002660412C|nr:probable LRR receptor-like serine/threonine-protein kinase At1g56140 [Rhododendron vialii]
MGRELLDVIWLSTWDVSSAEDGTGDGFTDDRFHGRRKSCARFHGRLIPFSRGKMKLRIKDLFRNYLTGPLSSSIVNLTQMQWLSLGFNALSGEVPKELGKLTNLRSLYVILEFQCNLLPTSTSLPTYNHLVSTTVSSTSISTNNFSGSLPSELGNLIKLEHLFFHSSGVSVRVFWLILCLIWLGSDNELTGSIPEFIRNWSKLSVLRFQVNAFEGGIPLTLSKLTALTDLRISDLSNRSSSLAFLKDMTSLSIFFENIETPSCVSARNIMTYSKEIVEAFKSPLIMGSQQACLISWMNPSTGNVKLNTDGCWFEMNGRGGFGGLFRDHTGDWIMGFYGMRHFSSSLEAEMWSIYTGLKIILERKLKNVTIESDSLTAVNLIKEGNPHNHPQSVLINEAHFIMAKTDTLIEHTYRSANQCADHLARMGIEQMDELVFVMNMPISLREFVIRDRLNIRILRNNHISGTIPSNIGDYQNLSQLHGSILICKLMTTRRHLRLQRSNVRLNNLSVLSRTKISTKHPHYVVSCRDVSYNQLSPVLPSWANNSMIMVLLMHEFVSFRGCMILIPKLFLCNGIGPLLKLAAICFSLSKPQMKILRCDLCKLIVRSSANGAYVRRFDCILEKLPCLGDIRSSPKYFNFAINCGGPEITSSSQIVYERDNETLGPATYYEASTKRWAVSNVGRFNELNDPQYTSFSSIQFNTLDLDSELLQTARISPGSLRYFGLGLENGNYNVTLEFAETAFLDPPS